jgi:putative tricarboxylic transport membrane protein
MSQTPGEGVSAAPRGIVKSPIDFAGGLFLLVIAATGYLGGFSLPVGHLSGIGSGLLPKSVAALVAVFGLVVVAQSFVADGDNLERFGIRGPIFVLGAVLVFAFTIRPLGLAIAGPLAILISALADKDTRPIEIIIFAVVMTVACIGLFKMLLRLPIPIFPPGYGPF